MTRHGKNCTAGAVYTYHEKKKDTGENHIKLDNCLPVEPCSEIVALKAGTSKYKTWNTSIDYKILSASL